MAESTVLSSSSSSDRLYQSSWRHPRTYSLILFSKKQYFKNFLGLFRGPRGSTPKFSNSSPRASYPRIFSRFSKPIYACGEAVEPNLQSHPYAPTSNVTLHNNLHPIQSPALTTVSTQLISYFYPDFTKALPFPSPPRLNTTIFGFPSSHYVT